MNLSNKEIEFLNIKHCDNKTYLPNEIIMKALIDKIIDIESKIEFLKRIKEDKQHMMR